MNGWKCIVPRWQFGLLATFLGTGAFLPVTVWALPQGGTVSSGSATISTPSTTKMQIDQATNRVVLDWRSFNIAGNEWVNFSQPSAASIALNRVAGQEPSAIYGRLTANGQIFLINPSGILFGSNSRVDVAGLTAGTLNITNADFLAGRYNFSQVPGAPNAAVVNQGLITAGPGGFVALLGAAARNEGVIQADLGSIVLASGKAATLDVRGDGLIDFLVTAPASGTVTGPNGESLTSYVSNTGTLQADGGTVLLTAQAAVDVIQSVVNQTGIIRARTMNEHAGEIVFSGGDEGIVSLSGTIDASGPGLGQVGGTVQVLGNKVGLFGADINASGDAGGGTVFVGGDVHGANPGIPNASATYVSQDSTIRADALSAGDGGKVVIWANDATKFYGSISARGGSQSGNGGFVEVSGKRYLDFQGAVDTRALHGRAGMLLLDPNNLTITATADTNITGTGLGSTPFTTTNDTAILTPNSIQTALLTGNVTVQTGSAGANTQLGNITVNSAITEGGGAGTNRLTLIASNNLTLSASITMNSGANLTLTSGGIINQTGGVLTANLLTTSSVGGTTLNNSNTVTTFTATNNTGGNISLTNTAGTLTLTGVNNSFAGGTVTINNTGNIQFAGGPAVQAAGGAVGITATGGSILHGAGGIPFDVNANGGAVTLTATTVGTVTGPVIVSAPFTCVATLCFINSASGSTTTSLNSVLSGIQASVTTDLVNSLNLPSFSYEEVEVFVSSEKISSEAVGEFEIFISPDGAEELQEPEDKTGDELKKKQ